MRRIVVVVMTVLTVVLAVAAVLARRSPDSPRPEFATSPAEAPAVPTAIRPPATDDGGRTPSGLVREWHETYLELQRRQRARVAADRQMQELIEQKRKLYEGSCALGGAESGFRPIPFPGR